MVAAALSFGVAPSVAWAQGNAALAEQLFSEGLAAMKAERWAAACEAFAGSNQADPSAGTEINLGVCSEKQKKYATALAWFDAAYRRSTEAGKERPDKAKVAKAEYDRVLPMVHKLKVTLAKPVEGAVIARNGEKLPAAIVVNNETKLDPGKYTFELSAKGKKAITKEVSIPETAGTTTLDFPAMEDAPIDKTTPGGGGDQAGGGSTIVVNDGSGQRTVAIIVGSAGILALLAAGGVQLLAIGEDKKREDIAADLERARAAGEPENNLNEIEKSRKSRADAAENNQLIAIITGAGGVVLLGVGVALFLTAPSGKSASGKPRVLPAVGPGYAGASFGFSF
jgi:tetratricopeptide (TPR) repeat protein